MIDHLIKQATGQISESQEEKTPETNLRTLISQMRQEVRENPMDMAKCATPQLLEFIGRWLEDEDAKTRKNAALLLGDIEEAVAREDVPLVLKKLWTAYCIEQKLFVKSSYLKGMKEYDCSPYQEKLQVQLDVLCNNEYPEEDLKHIRMERKELEDILQELSGDCKHEFIGLDQPYDILLVSDKCIRDCLKSKLNAKSLVVPFGVRVHTDNLDEMKDIPLYREMLFYIQIPKGIAITEENAGEKIAKSNLIAALNRIHKKNGRTFYFRLDIKGKMEETKRRNLLKKLSFELEEYSMHQLVNTPGNYEVEIRLLQRKDGTYAPFAKLLTIPDTRFSYRRHIEPTSLSPVVAAEMVELAKDYMELDAQIIDPFCGVGTLLIQRNRLVPAREIYGIDIYQTAIRGARENADDAQVPIHFINRDYFDFTHQYLFDEVICDFPRLYKSTKEEISDFYRQFFEKTDEITGEEARLILYTNEEGQIKKYLRLYKKFEIVRQIEMKKNDFLFVIKKRTKA